MQLKERLILITSFGPVHFMFWTLDCSYWCFCVIRIGAAICSCRVSPVKAFLPYSSFRGIGLSPNGAPRLGTCWEPMFTRGPNHVLLILDYTSHIGHNASLESRSGASPSKTVCCWCNIATPIPVVSLLCGSQSSPPLHKWVTFYCSPVVADILCFLQMRTLNIQQNCYFICVSRNKERKCSLS